MLHVVALFSWRRTRLLTQVQAWMLSWPPWQCSTFGSVTMVCLQLQHRLSSSELEQALRSSSRANHNIPHVPWQPRLEFCLIASLFCWCGGAPSALSVNDQLCFVCLVSACV
mmetsp:Transcript_19174/g.60989  ORF Transcript_19174/g.60989 Transcript_19174/m.60989 type:complete len:112 (-) Transcript_19174:6-341(-)